MHIIHISNLRNKKNKRNTLTTFKERALVEVAVGEGGCIQR